MQITSSIHHMPISLDPGFPIHAPYAGHLHVPGSQPARCMHYHDTLELGICCQGSGLFYIGGAIHAFTAGDVSIIMPGVAHIAQSAPDDLSAWRFIDLNPSVLLGESNQALCRAARFSGILRAGQDGGMGWLIERIQQEINGADPFRRESIRALVTLMLATLARQDSTAAPTEDMNEISPAVVYISTHYAERITIERLAALCNRSISSFRRAFERATGRQPFEYIYDVRIKAALNLLRGSDMPISEIAGRVGYATLSSFNRHFRRLTGKTPREVRQG